MEADRNDPSLEECDEKEDEEGGRDEYKDPESPHVDNDVVLPKDENPGLNPWLLLEP